LTFSFSAQASQIPVMAVLAPGTQWSQNPTVRLPAAPAVRTKGAATVAADAAADVAMNLRRVKVFLVICVFSRSLRLLLCGERSGPSEWHLRLAAPESRRQRAPAGRCEQWILCSAHMRASHCRGLAKS
jgi:hypothetical protein